MISLGVEKIALFRFNLGGIKEMSLLLHYYSQLNTTHLRFLASLPDFNAQDCYHELHINGMFDGFINTSPRSHAFLRVTRALESVAGQISESDNEHKSLVIGVSHTAIAHIAREKFGFDTSIIDPGKILPEHKDIFLEYQERMTEAFSTSRNFTLHERLPDNTNPLDLHVISMPSADFVERFKYGFTFLPQRISRNANNELSKMVQLYNRSRK